MVRTLGLLGLAMSVGVARAADLPSVEDGYRLLAAGQAEEASTAFGLHTGRYPGDPVGWAGLTWSRLEEGRLGEAIDAAEAWVGLVPQDEQAQKALLVVLAADPERRFDAIAANRTWLADHPDDEDAVLRLANLGMVEGDIREPEAVISTYLDAYPDAVEPRLLRGRIRGWRGRGIAARRDLAIVVALAPKHAEAHAARSLVETSLGREGAAARWVRRAEDLDPSDELTTQALAESGDATSPGQVTTWTVVTESSGIDRWTLAGNTFARPGPSTLVEVRPEAAWFRGIDDEVFRCGLEVRLVQELPFDFDLEGSVRAQWVPEEPVVMRGLAELAWMPGGLLRTSIGVRRRSMVDDPVVEGTALPPLVGSAGLDIEGIREGIHLDEAFLRASGAPLRGSYAYLEATLGRVADGNRRRSVSAGAGYDLLALVPEIERHALYARYEIFWVTFDEDVPDYWSPPGATSHAPGVEWHLTSWGSYRLVGLAAPVLQPGGPTGHMVGGSATLWLARRVQIGLGIRHQGNRYYQISGIDLRLDARM
ncbi:MAG: tetratricopeptide repeat protein [Deltaproteobacteria bacterium]|nr:tetratricopeptide repeat protein [Deltaproteobacteria bacterium]